MIKATEGKIGGFEISEEKLTSEKKNSESETPLLTLNGTEGKIIAEDIELTGKITVGESYLSNPNKNDNIVLKASNIELKNDGTLNLGTIRLYGGTGRSDGFISSMVVDSNNQSSYGNWAIYENGHADFKDITADNVTLKNSVLKIGTIQSAGSLMVFKEAWKIDSVTLAEASDGLENPLEITLKDYDKEYDILNVGDWIFTKGSASDSDNFFQIVKKVKVEVQYNKNQSNTIAPERTDNNWSTTTPDQEEGYYIWQRKVTITFEGNVKDTLYSLPVCISVAGTDAIEENTTFTLNTPKDIILKQNDIIMRLGESGILEYVEFSGEKFIPNRVYYEKNINNTYVITGDKEPKNNKTYYYEIVKPKEYIISISGSKDTKEDYASPNSLTISDFCIDNMEINKKSTKHLILGDLGNSKITELQGKGFGLYSDNVYLNGSLTTKNQDGISAGISTTHEQFVTDSEGRNIRVVFWAGAEGNNIKKAPFRVTQDGSIYANKGTFKGSIITDSIIQGSDVYTMRLHGGTQGGLDALQIYGTTIGFYEEEGKPDESIFTIGTNGFKKGENTFINLKDVPTFSGNLESGKIAVVNDEVNGNAINISKYKISLEYFEYNNEENERLTISQGGTNLIEIFSKNIRNKVSTYCDEDFWLGNKIHYQKVLTGDNVDGYDLYIED